jgi:hypothetical protein
LSYHWQDDDETTFKNRTLRFTNNNFLGGVTSGSGFAGVTSTMSQNNFRVDCAWGDQSQKNFHSGNINDMDEAANG